MVRKRKSEEKSVKIEPEVYIATNFHSNEDWKFERPLWDKDKCIRCGTCYLFCPDGAVYQGGDGYYEADLTYCKGCGLCSRQCWTNCITMEEAVKRFPWLIKL